jgi:DNA-binding XRE family transcriptional regulator
LGNFSCNAAGEDSKDASKERKMKQMIAKPKGMKSHGIPKLRIVRQRKGLSLGQLANLSGLRRDTISHLEDGREEAQPYHVRMLARALGVATFDLVS